MGKVMEAIEGFVTDLDGERFFVNKHLTRVDENHPLVKTFPQHFAPVEDGLTYEVEAATANPGEQRARTSRSAGKPSSTKTTEAVASETGG